MTYLEVLAPGMMTNLQDWGRMGHQAQGVPVSGALDMINLRLANHLVGNDQRVAALEIRMMGPTLRVESDTARVALTGTQTPIEVLSPLGEWIAAYRSAILRRGQVIRIGAIKDSAVCYLAVEGGFALKSLYGSQSTYLRGAFGGLEGRCLQAGDHLPLVAEQVEARNENILLNPPLSDDKAPIRVVLGPQDDYFSTDGIKAFLSGTYTVTSETNRMGMRLDGPKITHEKGFNITSDGIVTGSIQVPGTGQPIILLADHQSTGGYPKIATVASADIPRLGRMMPGSTLRFVACSVAEAEKARRQQEADLKHILGSVQTIPADMPLLDYLLSHTNLISGVNSDKDHH